MNNIKIDAKCKGLRFGLITGEIDGLSFSIYIEKKVIPQWKNSRLPENINGKVKSFFLYDISQETEGNPMKPSTSTKALVYIKFLSGEFNLLNRNYISKLNSIMEYFNKKHSFSIVK